MISPVMPTYARLDVSFVRGEGAYLFDADGQLTKSTEEIKLV